MKIPFNLSYFIIKREPVSLDSVGTKALNLLKLRKAFNVPQFIVLSTRAFKEGYKMNSLPLGVEKELRMVFEYFNKIGPIAVRSSATAEDTATASFAGMYNTTLNVNSIESVISAIIETWRSLDSGRCRNYREKMRCERGKMAVIIQHQLDPEMSGVMF